MTGGLRLGANRYLGFALAGVALAIYGISVSLFGVTNVFVNRDLSPPPALWVGMAVSLCGFLLALYAASRIRD